MNTTKTLIALMMMLSLGFLPANSAKPKDSDVIEVKGIYYRVIEGDNVCVTYKNSDYGSYAGWVSIPASWQGTGTRNIVAVGKCAFKDCGSLELVSMQNNILTIDSCAFQNCTRVTSASFGTFFFPERLQNIGSKALQNCKSIEEVAIPATVTSIGDHVFQGCSKLSKVIFIGDILSIPDGLFQGCVSLEVVNLPTSVVSIGDEAFKDSGLKQMTLGGALTTVGDSAFVDCVNFTRLNIKAETEMLSIGINAFAGSSLTTITCDAIIPPVLPHGIGLTPEQMKTVKLIIPKSTYDAYSQAEYWKDFVHIEEPQYDFAIQQYGHDIYYKIIGDDEVCITYKNTNYNTYPGDYGEQVVDWFDFTGKTEYWIGMRLPNSVTYDGKTYRVTAIGENAFRGCTNLNMLEWDGYSNIKHIGANAFKGCYNLKSVELPQKLQTIGAHAFEGCSKIPALIFPETVNLIDCSAFMGCSRLKYIILDSPMQIGSYAFSGTTLQGHDLSGGMAIICRTVSPPVLADSTVFDAKHYATSKLQVLYSVGEVFSNDENWSRFVNVKRLPYDFNVNGIYYRINNENEVGVSPDNEVFYKTYAGTVTIPESVRYCGRDYRVTSVERAAFYFSDIDKVIVPNSVKRIGDMAFALSSVNEVILGDSVETIGYGAFNESTLSKINFPKSLKHIGDSALLNTPDLVTITVDSDNPYFDSREDCNALIETATNRLVAGAGNCTEIPSTVTSITDFAFYGKDRLGHITIPGSISKVADFAFAACLNLSQVTFLEPTKRIGTLAFALSGLTSVVIPNSVDTIEGGAFDVCSKLKTVTLGTGLKYLGEMAFGKGDGGTSVIDAVICYATTPPTMAAANCFSGAYERATLFVPSESIALYKADPNWSQFFKIKTLEDVGIEEVMSEDAGKPAVRYNLQGQPVGDNYRSIVIENGRKILIE